MEELPKAATENCKRCGLEVVVARSSGKGREIVLNGGPGQGEERWVVRDGYAQRVERSDLHLAERRYSEHFCQDRKPDDTEWRKRQEAIVEEVTALAWEQLGLEGVVQYLLGLHVGQNACVTQVDGEQALEMAVWRLFGRVGIELKVGDKVIGAACPVSSAQTRELFRALMAGVR